MFNKKIKIGSIVIFEDPIKMITKKGTVTNIKSCVWVGKCRVKECIGRIGIDYEEEKCLGWNGKFLIKEVIMNDFITEGDMIL